MSYILRRIIIFCCVMFSCLANAAEVSMSLSVPGVEIDQNAQKKKDEFIDQVSHIASSINAQISTPILGIAPLGGTKITAFKELNLDGLVIIDWDRPGSPKTIQEAFNDSDLRLKFANVLREALNGGSMSSSTVMTVSVSAQLLARLYYELGVTSVRMQFYLLENDSQGLRLWDGPVMSDRENPLVTRFMFNYRGQPKELIYISSKITSDNVDRRNSLPLAVLNKLATFKFNWGYLSADGLIFFSKNHHNGMNKGNDEFLELMADHAGIILDYPQASYCTACKPENEYDGIASMCGREDLEIWGWKVIKKIPVNHHDYVFGYAGNASNDDVRVYWNPNHAGFMHVDTQSGIFSLDGMYKVGDDYNIQINT